MQDASYVSKLELRISELEKENAALKAGLYPVTDDATLDAVVANYSLTEVLAAYNNATCQKYSKSDKR